MNYQQTTHIPNPLLDKYIPILTGAELKILLIIIRQTYGWTDKKTGRRKDRDRISHSQFILKTGLSRKSITSALKNLLNQGLIRITDPSGNLLNSIEERRGKILLFYSFTLPSIFIESRTLTQKSYEMKQIGQILSSQSYQIREEMRF